MAVKIVWSFHAKKDIKTISVYWNKRNGNADYSNKIRRLTNKYLSLITQYPKIGKQTDNELVRFVVIREFKVFYSFYDETIYIIRFWDTRQDPDKLII